jgi:hypothetical protein
VGTGFRKTSCSSNNLKRDGDSKKSHHALGTRRPAATATAFARPYHFAGLVGFPMRRLYPAAFTTPSNGGWIMFGKYLS